MPLPGLFIDPKVYELWKNKTMQRERMDLYYMPSPEEWRRQMERHGYRVTDFLPNEQVYKATPEVKSILSKPPTQFIVDDPHTTPSSIPPQKANQEHMWDMLVLAARSSRYGE